MTFLDKGSPAADRPRLTRRLAVALFGVYLAVGGTFARAEAAPSYAFGGNAYGTYGNAKLGSVNVGLGMAAYLGLSCLGTNGRLARSSTASLAVQAIGFRAGVIESTALTTKSATAATLANTSSVANLSLFDGLITASSIKARASIAADARTLRTSTDGSELVGLKINGRTISATVAPNTRIDLPGVGRITLRRTTSSSTASRADVRVDMLAIDVTQSNRFGLAVGAQIILGHAQGAIIRAGGEVLVTGNANAGAASAGMPGRLQATLGPLGYVGIACEGSGGVVRRNNVGNVAIGNLLGIGAGESTAVGDTNAKGAYVETTTSLSNLRLLNGLVRVTAIKSVAREEVAGSVRRRSTNGTRIAGLTIAGVPVTVSGAPNTRVNVPGFGYLVLNEQVIPPLDKQGLMQVTGLRLVINQNNILKLAPGAQLSIARATAATLR